MTDVALDGISAADFRSSQAQNQLAELIRGKIVHTEKPNFPHQQITLAIASFFQQNAKKGTTCISPADLYLGKDNVLHPDVMWVSKNNERCVLRGGFWHNAPDVVVEVLSPQTSMRDRGVKFDLYEAHSVREYWMVDSTDRYIEVYRLESGRLIRQGLFACGDPERDMFRSTPLTLNVPLDVLFSP